MFLGFGVSFSSFPYTSGSKSISRWTLVYGLLQLFHLFLVSMLYPFCIFLLYETRLINKPFHVLTGEEAPNAPKGCYELDPGSILPKELLQVPPSGVAK
jgi:hypothetical protein